MLDECSLPSPGWKEIVVEMTTIMQANLHNNVSGLSLLYSAYSLWSSFTQIIFWILTTILGSRWGNGGKSKTTAQLFIQSTFIEHLLCAISLCSGEMKRNHRNSSLEENLSKHPLPVTGALLHILILKKLEIYFWAEIILDFLPSSILFPLNGTYFPPAS